MAVRRLGGGEVEFVGRKWRSEAGKVTPIGIGKLPDAGRVPFVPFNVGRGRKPVTGDNRGLPVPFTKIGSGTRPDGKRPDLGKVEFAVELAVGTGKKPELGWVGYAVKPDVGNGRLEPEMTGIAVPLALGKMPAETERIGKGRLETRNVGVSVVVPPVIVVVPRSS